MVVLNIHSEHRSYAAQWLLLPFIPILLIVLLALRISGNEEIFRRIEVGGRSQNANSN